MTQHELNELTARQLLAKLQIARHRRPMKHDGIHCQVNADHCILHLPLSIS